MDSPPGSARSTRSIPSSPEAEVGHRVEDLWDIQEPQLSPTQKLNSCFESMPVSSFPAAPPSQVIEIPSDCTLSEAVRILSENKILSAPVRDVDAPEDASWIDKYIGMVEFAGIAVWLLHQSELAGSGNANSANTNDANEMAAKIGTVVTLEATESPKCGLGARVVSVESFPEVADAASGGSFFETLTSSEFYKNTKVCEISGSFRWAPFLALQNSDSFLTMLLLLSKCRMKTLPVVDLGEGKIDNIISQTAVVHMLAECVGLHWFEDWGMKTLSQLGLPYTDPNRIVKVREGEPVLRAFQLMRKRGLGGLPIVDGSGKKAIGTISIRDVQYLLTHPEIYKDYRSITAKVFIMTVKNYLEKNNEVVPPNMYRAITCKIDEATKDVILRMDAERIRRIYVVNEDNHLKGVITLRDIISRLVHEPHGYFGDFFDGVVPMPKNSRV